MSVNLTKIPNYFNMPSQPVHETDLRSRRLATVEPGCTLVGHRAGLRMNDPITLASAFWITCESRLAS